MKNYILSFLFFIITFNGMAQIIANRTINSAIKIDPTGIIGKMNNKNISSTNLAIGENSLQSASEVINNTAIGYNALLNAGINFPNAYNNNNNTAVGASTLFQNQQGYNNSALGWSTLTGGIGYENTAFGRTCLTYNTSGSNNAGFGFATLSANTTGNYNTGFGVFSLNANQTTNYNTAFAMSSLRIHTTGDNNTAFGESALYSDQSGTNNAVFGNSSLYSNISGSSNTSFGTNAMFGNKTGNSNVGFGYYALVKNDGQSNTGIGNATLDQNTTGVNNVTIGNFALHSNVTGSGNVAIGNSAGYYETGSNRLFIDGNSTSFSGSTTTIGGDFTATKVCIGCNLALTGANDFNTRTEAFQVQGAAFKKLGNGTWQFPSDSRLKTNIVSLNRNDILEKVIAMQGVNYDLINNPEQGNQYGFIAQDLRKVFPTKVYENKAGFLSASYGDFVPMFVEAIKALNERVEKLEENNPDIKAITARVEEMEEMLKVK